MKNHILIDLFLECTLTCNAMCKHCGSSAEKKKYDGLFTGNFEKKVMESYKFWKMIYNGI